MGTLVRCLHFSLGFALLPDYVGHGCAFEAARGLMGVRVRQPRKPADLVREPGETNMAAYLTADGDVSDAQVYEEYRQKVPAAESTALEPVRGGRCVMTGRR